jgi:hypothetical protein
MHQGNFPAVSRSVSVSEAHAFALILLGDDDDVAVHGQLD